MSERKYTVKVLNDGLVQWLGEQGVDVHKDMVHDFILEKGMGERLELRIVNYEAVELTFYGVPEAEPKD